MTIFYECDICGQVYEDENECSACEYSHEHKKYFKQIHIWNTAGISIEFGFHNVRPEDIHIIRCETPEAWGVVENWFDYYGMSSPGDYCDYIEDDIVFWSVPDCRWKSVAETESLLNTYKTLCYKKEN